MSKHRHTLLAALSATAVVVLSAQSPTFDVASVVATSPERQNRLRLEYCQRGGRFFVGGAPVLWSLRYAFRLRDFQIAGAPSWLTEFASSYDIEGTPAAPVDEQRCRLMVQSLFADRFKLRTHRESRNARVYLLLVGKNGPKLRGRGPVIINGGRQIEENGRPTWPNGLTMSQLSGILASYTDRPVLDRTGLEGPYAVTLDFSVTDDDGRVNLFTAVQEQLGLKLEAGRAPVEMLVIDHIERPTPD